ncbi:MAG: DUF3572 domain-containing protein [Aestuariivita sp.]|nr:DUF3572 domain-containing protein [Aestuariivita sp.]
MTMTTDAAETVALKILGWLVSNHDLLPVFLDTTGASKEDIRAQASNTDFLISILDFISMHDVWVRDCCHALNLDCSTFLQVRTSLPGGAHVHWT